MVEQAPIPTARQLSEAVSAAAGIMLGRTMAEDPIGPLAHEMVDPGIDWSDDWLQKADRYSVAGPLIKIMADHMVEGHGLQARFRNAPMPQTEFERKMSPPRSQLMSGTRQLFVQTAIAFKSAHGTHTGLMEAYTDLSEGLDKEQNITSGEGMVAGGGDFPPSIFDYVTAVKDLIDKDAELSELSPEGQRDFAHELLPRALGRHAKMHVRDFQSTPTVEDLHKAGRVSLPKNPNGSRRLDMGGALRASASTDDRAEYTTPPLTCPAYMEFEGEPETAFETFVHAGVNYAYDLGVFGGEMAPLPEVVPLRADS